MSKAHRVSNQELVMLLIWRLISILLVALTTGLGFARVLEMPAKLLYDAELYVTVQKTLYAFWGPPNIGGFLEPAAILATLVLCMGVRRRRRAFWLTLSAAAIQLLAFPVVYFLFVEPVNAILSASALIPENWMELRLRWERGHGIRFLLQLVALCLLLLSALFETGKRKFMSNDY
jgi:hypothetical protein